MRLGESVDLQVEMEYEVQNHPKNCNPIEKVRKFTEFGANARLY